jgi:hypothetical protein
LQTLTPDDARAILDAVAGGAEASDASSCFIAAREAWERKQSFSIGVEEHWRNALRLYLEAVRDRTDIGGPFLKTAVIELARVLPNTKSPLTSISSEQAEPRYTPFGGMFLLLPLIDELPLPDATRGWPDAEESEAVALVRFLLLLKCCGGSRAAKAFYDPLLRDLLAIASTMSPSVLAAWQMENGRARLKEFLKVLADWRDQRGVTTDVLAPRDEERNDLAYLSLPKSFQLSRSLDVTLSVVARAVMRSFARRLPGFSGSHLPYLYGNFLDIHASVTDEADRRVVELSRPPLYLILNMTGMARQSYVLSWLDGRPLCLFPES